MSVARQTPYTMYTAIKDAEPGDVVTYTEFNSAFRITYIIHELSLTTALAERSDGKMTRLDLYTTYFHGGKQHKVPTKAIKL